MYICTVADCGSLSPPLNGDVSMNGTVYESVAMYTCHDGYTLMGEHHRRICLDNSSWSHQQPLCECKISLIINERVTSLCHNLQLLTVAFHQFLPMAVLALLACKLLFSLLQFIIVIMVSCWLVKTVVHVKLEESGQDKHQLALVWQHLNNCVNWSVNKIVYYRCRLRSTYCSQEWNYKCSHNYIWRSSILQL